MVRRNLIRALGLDASEKNIKIAEWMESNGGEWIEWMVESAQRKTDDKTFWRYVAALKLVKKSLGAAEKRLREIIEEIEREQDSWWSADHDAPYPPKGQGRTLEELEAVFNWHIARRLEGVVSDISAEAVGDDGKMAEDFPTYIAWLRLLGHLFLGAARDRIKAICEEEERRAFAMGVHAHLTDKEIEYGEMDCRWQTAVAMRDRRLARDCVNAMRKECERTTRMIKFITMTELATAWSVTRQRVWQLRHRIPGARCLPPKNTWVFPEETAGPEVLDSIVRTDLRRKGFNPS